MKIIMCKLKNDSVVPYKIVEATMKSLKSLQKDSTNPIGNMFSLLAFHELAKLASNPQHELFSNELKNHLINIGLIQEDNRLDEPVKKIILSAVIFNGEYPEIVNPVEKLIIAPLTPEYAE